MTATTTHTDRYTIVSSDGHAGADVADYRPFLERKYHDEFDRWRAVLVNPFADLERPGRTRNWDSDERLRDLDADGIVAEVLFPNTLPPFFPSGSLVAVPPTAEEYELRWAGLQAHNRWLADFCAETPGRRAGMAQIFLNDVDKAVAEIGWAKEAGLFGGVLLPGVPPDADIPPLYAADYEPIWAACEELDMPINNHSGSAAPDYGDHAAARPVLLTELGWFSHRSFWHLMFGLVFERHPRLKLVLTEQSGASWVPGMLRHLDELCMRMTVGGSESNFAGDVVRQLSLTPSEYWQRNCYVGASFMTKADASVRHEVGVDRILWGGDYPHVEGTYPYSRESFRHTFAGVAADEIAAILGGNAAHVYGFDLDRLAPLAATIGPAVDEVATPLGQLPDAPLCRAFTEPSIVKPW